MVNDEILQFCMELSKVVLEVEKEVQADLVRENSFHFDYTMAYMEDLAYAKDSEEAKSLLLKTDKSISEFKYGSYDFCLGCEGPLYEALYYYEGFGSNLIGKGEEAKRLYNSFDHVCVKYDMVFEFDGGGLDFQTQEHFRQQFCNL